jgi:TrwC relaxase
VVADIAKLSVGRQAYYTRELATDHEQYLSGHGESPGRWYGAGATSLGLQGEASVAGFQAMFEGRDPTTGELLGRPHGREAVPAFDVVLRQTKSASVLYGLGDPATGHAVLAAHHAGVQEAVAYLDEPLGARRGHGGVQHVSGQGLLSVGFDHRTSREGDPLLHTHLVVANRVQGPDGRWTAGTCTGIGWPPTPSTGPPTSGSLSGRSGWRGRRRTPTATGGCRACPTSCCAPSPSGPTRSTSRSSGCRPKAGERTPRLVKWTVQATRKPKQHETPDTLYGRWRTEAAERGVNPDTLVQQVTDRTRDREQHRTVSDQTVAGVFDRLACPDGLTAQASTFARPDVIAALGGQLAGATRAELEELTDRFLAQRTVAVVAERAVEERRWSTPELLATEQRLVAAAPTGSASRPPW